MISPKEVMLMPITKASFSGGEQRAMPAPPDDDADDQVRAAAKKTVIKTGKGKPNIAFKPGGLHESLGVPDGEPIPGGKLSAALAGKHGPKAQKQANFAKSLAKMRPAAPAKRAEAPEMPAGIAKLPPALAKKAMAKQAATRTLGPEAGAMLVPTAVLGSNKKRGAKK
jgi:hypothetical protein